MIPLTYASKKTIGGNAHENWSLIRFLPLLIGQKVPVDEPTWQVLTDLRDIVDLVVAPIHTEESIAFLDFKISEHRTRFQDLFPDANIFPKQHFLEHYPQLIRNFGPLVALWSMRFEAKHGFFKRVIRHTRCFKNVLYSLSEKHQFQMAYHLHTTGLKKSALKITGVTVVSIDLLRKEIALAIKRKEPDLECVFLAKSVTFKGYNYRNGMLVPHGSLAGLPEFNEIIQMIILKEMLLFVV